MDSNNQYMYVLAHNVYVFCLNSDNTKRICYSYPVLHHYPIVFIVHVLGEQNIVLNFLDKQA